MAGLVAASQKMQASMIKMANASEGGAVAALLAVVMTSEVSCAATAQTLKAQSDGLGQLLDVMA